MKRICLFFTTLIFALSTSGWTDGGRFVFDPELDGSPIENSVLTKRGRVSLELDGEEQEFIYFEHPSEKCPVRFIYKHSPNPFLICDQNMNKKWDDDPRITGKKDGHEVLFSGIPMPVRIHDVTHVLPSDVEVYRGSRLIVNQWSGSYQGNVRIGETQYKATLSLISPFPGDHQDNGIIILDDSEQSRNSQEDKSWIASDGLFIKDGGAWVAKTDLSEATAKTEITEYQGKTKKIQFPKNCNGRIRFRFKPHASLDVSVDMAFLVDLKFEKGQEIALPTGEIYLERVWLYEPDSPVYYHYPSYTRPGSLLVFDTAEVESIQFPLKEQAHISTPRWNTSRKIQMSYSGAMYDKDKVFERLYLEGHKRPPAPQYEVLDKRGNIITQGRFAYG
jgi:hypothetical protein